MKLISTGIEALDRALAGGVPSFSLNILAGPPGSGKTIFAEQLLFGYVKAHPEAKVLYLATLSEPGSKVTRYVQNYTFFDFDSFGEAVIYADIGEYLRESPLDDLLAQLMKLVNKYRPELLVVDSFKAIRDIAPDQASFRRFCHGFSVHLASAGCTTLWVGEYTPQECSEGTEFAVADGILSMGITKDEGEMRRVMKILKMRGRPTRMTPLEFTISDHGIRVLDPEHLLEHSGFPGRSMVVSEGQAPVVESGIVGLDALLRGGIPRARSVIVSGVSGTGKTTLVLQYLVEGALRGERGLLYSFEETPERLHELATGFGWDLARLEREGVLRIRHIPQSKIRVTENMVALRDEIAAWQPQRVVIDSFSVFLHRIQDSAKQRTRTYHIVEMVAQSGAVGLFTSDTPADAPEQLSRFGVEETMMDGTIVLTSEVAGLARRRYIEVYKMRGVNHLPGKHRLEITGHGIDVFYASVPEGQPVAATKLTFDPVDKVIGEALPYTASWLIRGDPGVGKSMFSFEFAVAGLRRRENVLYITTDTSVEMVRYDVQASGFLIDPYLESGQLVILEPLNGQQFDRYSEKVRNADGVAQLMDLQDLEGFLYALIRQVAEMPRPLRVIIDSLTPLVLASTPEAFVRFVDQKNRLLRHNGIVVVDTLLRNALPESYLYQLLNMFDIALDLFVPDWGEMQHSGQTGQSVLQVIKARGVTADRRPYPYTITRSEGLRVQQSYYNRLLE